MEIRPKVMKFAEAMERKLIENEGKGGWEDCSVGYLVKRTKEELRELVLLSNAGLDDASFFLDEAADIANFLMMLCDVRGHLED